MRGVVVETQLCEHTFSAKLAGFLDDGTQGDEIAALVGGLCDQLRQYILIVHCLFSS